MNTSVLTSFSSYKKYKKIYGNINIRVNQVLNFSNIILEITENSLAFSYVIDHRV